MNEIDIADEKFEEIFCDIKKRYLSKTNFPKFIIGTGLSITFKIPGMQELANELNARFSEDENSEYKDTWERCEPIVRKKGLEAALLTVSTQDNGFVERIREITSKFILEADYEVRESILKNRSAFERLLGYLIKSVSVNKKIIDIMTPNYDLIIEIIADKLNLTTTLGFKGNVFQTFDQEILKKPSKYFKSNHTILRVFKPHGSINWINRDGRTYQINDYTYLDKSSNCIEIVAPGSMKFKYGMTHDLLRQHREIFNSVYTDGMSSHSIFIYGYGFNDQQFDTVFENTTKDVIVLSMEIKKSIIDRALVNTNWTVFYKKTEDEEADNGYSFMIYNGKHYKLNSQLWNLDDFVENFIGTEGIE